VQPKPNEGWGPGFALDATTDLIGPIPIDWNWVVEWLTGPVGNEQIITTSYPIQTVQHRLRVTFLETPVSFAIEPFSTMTSTEGSVRVRLQMPSTQIVEEAQIPIRPDLQTGVLYQLRRQTQATGGFTEQDRAQLTQTAMSVGFGIGGGWTDLAQDLIATVGRRILGTELIVPDLSGEGVLTRPGGPFGVNAFGIQWQLLSAPPGIGFDEGVPDRTEIDHMQLTFMRGSSQGLVTVDSRYVADINGQWVWGLDSPDQLDYFVIPGVTVRAWWLLLQIGVFQEPIGGPTVSHRPTTLPHS
jgi:hypothetical protein